MPQQAAAPLKLAFAGTPDFSRTVLQALLDAGHAVCTVLTQPDRPAGRHLHAVASPVKQLAQDHALPVLQPPSLRLDGAHAAAAHDAQQHLQALAPDVLVVVAYGLLLPTWTLNLPRLGCLNVHASLLPRWRGAAPIQRAIEAGDICSGVTIMQMDAGLDTGPMLLQRTQPIATDDTAASLHDALARLGAQALLEVLHGIATGQPPAPRAQPAQGATYAAKLSRAESVLDFNQPARRLANRVRAFNPFPGARMSLPGLDAPVKVWAATAIAATDAPGAPRAAAPGTVLAATDQGIDVATGCGVLRITELQRAGGRRQAAASFVRGWAVRP